MNPSQNEILSQMPIPKAIAKIGIPAMASMMIMAIYNLVDTLFIGMLGDDRALSAVAVAFPIMTLIGAVGQVFGAGAAATIGRAFGGDNDEQADKTATTTIFTSFIAGILFMILGLVFIEPIFKLFGTTDSVMPLAKQYGTWMYIGSVFSIPNQSFNNIARAETKAMLSMRALSIGAVSNIILDPIFMFELGGFGLNMGIEGASIATTLAQAIAFAYISFFFFSGRTRVKISPKNFAPGGEIYGDVLRSGMPIGLTQMLGTLAVSFTNIAAVDYATDVTIAENIQSAYGIVLKVSSILQFIVMGYLMGYQPIASYAYGAKNKQRFFECFNYSLKIVLAFTIPITVILQLIAPYIMTMFTKTPEIIEIGSYFVRYNNIFLVLMGLSFFIMLTFQATGNGSYGAVIALARQGFLYIPTLFILCTLLGVFGMYYAQAFADLVTAIIALLLFRRYRKTHLIPHFDSSLPDLF